MLYYGFALDCQASDCNRPLPRPQMRISSTIVLYYPDPASVVLLLKTLSKGLINEFFVIDNTPQPLLDVTSALEYLGRTIKLKYIQNNANLGLSKAQNIGINEALMSNSDYLFFSDQDSTFSSYYMLTLLKCIREIESYGHSSFILGGAYRNSNSPSGKISLPSSNIRFNHHIRFAPMVTSSGSIITASTFRKIGLMDENLFIDTIDYEFSRRASANNIPLFLCDGIAFEHRLGKATLRIPCTNIEIGIDSSTRENYKFKALKYLCRKKHISLSWKIKTLLRLAIVRPIVIVYELHMYLKKLF